MACYTCLGKLAGRLMRHRGVDMIRAYELASKALERVEKRAEAPPPQQPEADPDYTQPCQATGDFLCAFVICFSDADCPVTSSWCDVACPAPLPNSHLVSHTCIPVVPGCYCLFPDQVCIPRGPCGVTGLCSYDCDPGYVWNGEACVPVPAVGYQYSNGLVTVQV